MENKWSKNRVRYSTEQNLIAPDLSAVEPVQKLSRSMRMGNALHATGVGTMTISIFAHIWRSLIESRHLTLPTWLSSCSTITPYSLWAGLLFVFAGILVLDRSWSRRRTGSN
jgi:hypothetical protein